MPYSEIKFIRHATGDHMGDPGMIVGQSPQADLTLQGLKEASLLGRVWHDTRYSPDAVLTSPVWRCRRTARSVLTAAGIERSIRLDSQLAEMSQGELEGRVRTPEIAEEMDRLKGRYRAPGINATGMPGETFGDVVDRWMAHLTAQSIATATYGDNRRQVAAFSHRVLIGAGLSYLMLRLERDAADIHPDDVRDRFMATRGSLPIPPCSETLVVIEPRSDPEQFDFSIEYVGQRFN